MFLTVNKQLKNDSLCDTVLNVFSNYRFDGNILVLGTHPLEKKMSSLNGEAPNYE